MNRNTGMYAGQVIGRMNGLQVFGLDIAKSVFQVHTLNMETGEILDKRLKREKVLEYFANRSVSVVAMEACGGAHYDGTCFVFDERGGVDESLAPAAPPHPGS